MPSEAAERAAAAYMTSGNPLLQLHPNDTRELAAAFDAFALAAAEAMRERAAECCYTDDMAAGWVADAIRALPLQETKQ